MTYSLLLISMLSWAQGNEGQSPKQKPVKNTFGSAWIMDNQSVMVPEKGTLEFDIQHRFGVVNKDGIKDLFGFFAPSNIRLGLSYAPVKNLNLGAGITKERMQVDLFGKYAILMQTPGSMPISMTYLGNAVIDARDKENFRYGVHRLSYFNQLIFARKFSDKFSAQVAPSLSWFNNVEAYVDKNGEIQPKMNNEHLAVSFSARYAITEALGLAIGLDQPLTTHTTNNPHPNINFGIDINTSSHAFQIFAGNYYGIVPQSNNMYNQNNFRDGQFLLGFNITRLWNY